MKICSQCGYCNGDYMESCNRCHSPLHGQQGISAPFPSPYAPGQPASRPGQSLPQTEQRMMASMGRAAPATANPLVPISRQLDSHPAQNPMGMFPPENSMRSPYPQPPATQFLRAAPRQPFPQQPSAWPPRPGAYPPPLYGQNTYQGPIKPQPPIYPPSELTSGEPSFSEDENPNSVSDFSTTPAKRSSAGIVVLIFLFLLLSIGGVTWWFYTNELFSMETRMTIDSVIDSVTGFFTGSDASDTPSGTDSEAYNTMLSRVRNSVGTDDAQAKAIVDTLLYTCGASSIDGIIIVADMDVFQINSPEGRFHIRVDSTNKTLTSVETIESIPRAIYSGGTSHASIADYCVPPEEEDLLKKDAQDALKSALTNPELVSFSDADWEFHKEKDWVAVSCFAISSTEGVVENRIPFYFEYQKQNNTFKRLYAQINDKPSGTPHFAEENNPYKNEGDYGATSSEGSSSAQPAE